MKSRPAVLVLLALFSTLAVVRAAASPVPAQTTNTPQRFVVFEAFMRAT